MQTGVTHIVPQTLSFWQLHFIPFIYCCLHTPGCRHKGGFKQPLLRQKWSANHSSWGSIHCCWRFQPGKFTPTFTNMWTLRPGVTTYWIMLIPTLKRHSFKASSSSWLIRPHHCYVNSSIKNTADQNKALFEAGEGVAGWSHGSITGLVSGCIQKCMEDVSIMKNIRVWANSKPWMTSEVHALLKARNSTALRP